MANTDKQVQDLFNIVQQKKTAISKAERPNWITNCSFGVDKNSSSRTNLQVCADVRELVSILAFLIEKKKSFDEAQEILGTNFKFDWMGYSFEDWKLDIQTRIDKIEITKKKKELEILEERLNSLISPELKRQMELDEITKALSK